ncbi:MAG TPA: hypothetical protein VHP34_00070 [Alphaproteobacteria bacterium]|jgi:hypothetical protein|nr:hypothetical protein [Alphaproteobacteria bacterium]
MSEHKKKCCGGTCHTDFKKSADKPVTPPPANEQKPEAPKKKCCGGGCHPKK